VLTTKTVFVLGAGASHPFDYPVGATLFEEVVSNLSHASNREELCKLAGHQFDVEHVASFQQALFRSGLRSVDAFLEHRAEFLEIGKAIMARLLITHEQPDHLWQADNAKNWMPYLFGRLMTTSFEKFEDNRVSFITFNYDRSLEYFLFQSLKNTFGKQDNECAALLSKIPIIHLHGRLGFLPWEGKEHEVTREYKLDINPRALEICKRGIKVIHEDISDERDQDFENAKALLREAEVVFFLGFGFAPLNAERLNLGGIQFPTARATALGLKSSECRAISAMTSNTVVPHDMDCLGLLREYGMWN
jgi:hypothetical protein